MASLRDINLFQESVFPGEKPANFGALDHNGRTQMEGTKYGPIFLMCVIVGAIVIFVPSSGLVAGGQLVYFGMKGLLVEQQMEKEAIEFKHQVYLRELDEKHRQAEHEREMQRLRLRLPAAPDQGY